MTDHDPPVITLPDDLSDEAAMVSEAQRVAYRPPTQLAGRRLVHAIQVPQGSRNVDVNEPRESVSVVVGYRERNSGVLGALATMPGVEVRVEHLPVGDYLVGNVFVFERKTLVDLVASIMDDQLFKQACRLACDARRSAFILEGTLTQLAQSQMRREAIQGALVTITLMLGLPVLRSRDPYESARLMVYAFTRSKVERMGRGLFPRAEHAVLALVERSVVFLTPDNIDEILHKEMCWPGSARAIANLYLGGIDTELLSEEAPRLVGFSQEAACYVSPAYFEEKEPLAVFVVHEVAGLTSIKW